MNRFFRGRAVIINEFTDTGCPVTKLAFDLGAYLQSKTVAVNEISVSNTYHPGGLRPRRIFNLLLMHCLLPWVLFAYRLIALFRNENLVVVVTTLPPLIHWTALIWGQIFGITTIVWYQDAHPEMEARAFDKLKLSVFSAALRGIDQLLLGRASGFVVLDEAMGEFVARRTKGKLIPRVIAPPWSAFFDGELPLRRPCLIESGEKIELFYAGNYGQAHDLEPLRRSLEVAGRELQNAVKLTCIGMNAEGVSRIEQLFKGMALELVIMPRVASLSSLLALMKGQDWGIVCLKADYAGIACPSKALTYLSQGLPIIYCGPDATLPAKLCQSGWGLKIQDIDWQAMLRGGGGIALW